MHRTCKLEQKHISNWWLGVTVVRSRTSDSKVVYLILPGPLSSNNLEQVIYTRGAEANSAFHLSSVGK